MVGNILVRPEGPLAVREIEARRLEGCVLDAEFDAFEMFGQLVDKLLLDGSICRYSHGYKG